MSAPQIKPTNLKVWTNRHETFKQPIDNLFDISNSDTGSMLNDYNATTAAVAQLIDAAVRNNKRLRVLGGGWSFTKVATTDGWMLNSKHLNMVFTVSETNVAAQYRGRKDLLLFAQCGNSVQELNTYLKNKSRSLKTTGASNGQTIVGAFSTGTHGAAIDFGSTQDYVVGLHIITGPGKHIWLERASYPVVSDAFIQKLQTQLVRDDELFNAALISFGSFGFIHGVMLETEDIFLLECYRQRMPMDDHLRHIMGTLDFSNAQFRPHGNERPFHFQVVVNPYDMDNGAYVTTMFKRSYQPNYPQWVRDFSKAGPGDDAPAFLGKLTANVPVLTHLVVDQLVKSVYAPFENVWGTMGEIFYNTDARGKIYSSAFGIPLNYVSQVHDLIMELNKTAGPVAGVFAYRYVRQSEATLSFTQYPHTCIVEIDVAESSVSKNFYAALWGELFNRNIPHAFHWGKMQNLDAAAVQRIYGDRRDRWIAARNQLLAPEVISIFNNQALKEWGLDEVRQALRPV
ncbi:FAD-binding protein [Chitinophagaceae bacterium LB-8]|uniref:FAD-binding protein n=1 Tax=Paraflavisolibacter caeni TaxID=2982496 RepID=A0A9X3BIV9_9BACT|nr:FAD-binding protein [Paraflavisolibacter caeni]MCU7552022.1 FAD-binding protein [Paraflavisolibacter caeni]